LLEDYIQKISEDIQEREYCLDTNCFRKELSFDKADKEYFSRIAN
jgi:hypothetical protein